jgi:hypothetical protein
MASSLALVPAEPERDDACVLAIAEQIHGKSKMANLEQAFGKLQKTSLAQHEVMSHLQGTLRNTVSETDLRRAIGLAFQEFELRLEDSFQDSSRKCLSMFAKREEVSDLQGQIAKKVSCLEFNAVLNKMTELRKYLDTMAESIFVGHREALNSEFNKKADKQAVEEALTKKVDVTSFTELSERLERLEVLVSKNDAKHSAKLQELWQETERARNALESRVETSRASNSQAISKLHKEHQGAVQRLGVVESEAEKLKRRTNSLDETLSAAKKRQEEFVVVTLRRLEEHLGTVDALAKSTQQELNSLEALVQSFKRDSGDRFGELGRQAATSKEHIEFLMQATEMIKRRAREQTKSNAGQFSELGDGQKKLSEQLAALERQFKRQERDMKAELRNTQRSAAEVSPPLDGNDRLRGVLEQLEKIGAGCGGSGATPALTANVGSAARPALPLPWVDSDATTALEADLGRFTGSAGPSPIDSARGARSGYAALSPSGPTSARGLRKKR